jgi:hypothetical protein
MRAQLPGQDTLLLADNLNSQVKKDFQDAVKKNARADVRFGVKKGSHVWQPVDHHIGVRYHVKMDEYYNEWMAEHYMEDYRGGSVPVEKRRQLMTQWAGRAYRFLEEERVMKEEARLLDPTAPHSCFYLAFLRTGCLVTVDGTGDEEIKPHNSIIGDLETKFRQGLATPEALQARLCSSDGSFIIELSEEDGEEEEDDEEEEEGEEEELAGYQEGAEEEKGEDNSEDEDDEPWDESDEENDDGEREPIPDNLELDVPDEQGLIAAARVAAEGGGESELNNFRFAARVAREDSLADRPDWHSVVPVAAPGGVRRSVRARRVRNSIEF